MRLNKSFFPFSTQKTLVDGTQSSNRYSRNSFISIGLVPHELSLRDLARFVFGTGPSYNHLMTTQHDLCLTINLCMDDSQQIMRLNAGHRWEFQATFLSASASKFKLLHSYSCPHGGRSRQVYCDCCTLEDMFRIMTLSPRPDRSVLATMMDQARPLDFGIFWVVFILERCAWSWHLPDSVCFILESVVVQIVGYSHRIALRTFSESICSQYNSQAQYTAGAHFLEAQIFYRFIVRPLSQSVLLKYIPALLATTT